MTTNRTRTLVKMLNTPLGSAIIERVTTTNYKKSSSSFTKKRVFTLRLTGELSTMNEGYKRRFADSYFAIVYARELVRNSTTIKSL